MITDFLRNSTRTPIYPKPKHFKLFLEGGTHSSILCIAQWLFLNKGYVMLSSMRNRNTDLLTQLLYQPRDVVPVSSDSRSRFFFRTRFWVPNLSFLVNITINKYLILLIVVILEMDAHIHYPYINYFIHIFSQMWILIDYRIQYVHLT